MKKTCAFCGQEKRLTKEHVWPSCFMDRVGRNAAHYSPKSGIVHGSDYVVRDVCFQCNNVHLSELDNYFCGLYDRHLSIPLGADDAVDLNYDYDLLCRVLLKIAYNTARSAGSEVLPFQRLLPYILHGGMRPLGVVLIGKLVSPTLIEDRSGAVSVVKEVRPTMYRSALGQLLTAHGNVVLARIIAVNSFFFHLLLLKDFEELHSFDLAASEFLAGVQGSVRVQPDVGTVQLKSSPQDSLSSMLPLLMAKRDQYRRFFDGKKKKDDR